MAYEIDYIPVGDEEKSEISITSEMGKEIQKIISEKTKIANIKNE